MLTVFCTFEEHAWVVSTVSLGDCFPWFGGYFVYCQPRVRIQFKLFTFFCQIFAAIWSIRLNTNLNCCRLFLVAGHKEPLVCVKLRKIAARALRRRGRFAALRRRGLKPIGYLTGLVHPAWTLRCRRMGLACNGRRSHLTLTRGAQVSSELWRDS